MFLIFNEALFCGLNSLCTHESWRCTSASGSVTVLYRSKRCIVGTAFTPDRNTQCAAARQHYRRVFCCLVLLVNLAFIFRTDPLLVWIVGNGSRLEAFCRVGAAAAAAGCETADRSHIMSPVFHKHTSTSIYCDGFMHKVVSSLHRPSLPVNCLFWL